MPKKKTPTKFETLSLAQQVQRAMPCAKDLVAAGARQLTEGPDQTDPELVGLISTLIGAAVDEYLEEDGYDRLEHGLQGAMALGIAFGLLVRPEAFLIGGAR